MRRRAGLPMMSVEVTEVPQCRVGPAPIQLDGPPAAVRRRRASLLVVWRPWVAMTGSPRWPMVMTACSWRRIAAAITAWAWVTVRLLCCLLVRWVNQEDRLLPVAG